MFLIEIFISRGSIFLLPRDSFINAAKFSSLFLEVFGNTLSIIVANKTTLDELSRLGINSTLKNKRQ